jgi:hypothetical protein
MIAQIRAELLKIRSTRTTIGLILGMMALILLITLLTGLLTHPSGFASKEDQRDLLGLSSLTSVFSALAGVLLVTSEYRFGTIRPTILFNPARSRVLAAKFVADALAGIAFGVVGEAIGWAIGSPSSTGVASPSCSAAETFCCSRLEGSPARPCGARSARASARSSTTKSAASSRYSPGASSSTASCLASSHRSDGSRQPVPRTH